MLSSCVGRFDAYNCETMECGYAPKGQPPVLPVETKRERVNMISAISRQGSLRYMIYQDSMNQQKLIGFMRRLIADRKGKVFLIMDNLRVHHGKLVSAWLERHKSQIEVFYGSGVRTRSWTPKKELTKCIQKNRKK